jgi:hypothetical protein
MSKKSQKHRELLIKTYGHLYEKHFSSRAGCFYCGDIASTVDHCPPISFCDVKDQKWFKEKNIKFYKVSSCFDCNKKLGAKHLFTLYERANFIMNKLETQTDKVVNWSQDEMQEMSAMFEKIIQAKQEKNKILYERVRFCQELIVKPNDFPLEEM